MRTGRSPRCLKTLFVPLSELLCEPPQGTPPQRDTDDALWVVIGHTAAAKGLDRDLGVESSPWTADAVGTLSRADQGMERQHGIALLPAGGKRGVSSRIWINQVSMFTYKSSEAVFVGLLNGGQLQTEMAGGQSPASPARALLHGPNS